MRKRYQYHGNLLVFLIIAALFLTAAAASSGRDRLVVRHDRGKPCQVSASQQMLSKRPCELVIARHRVSGHYVR